MLNSSPRKSKVTNEDVNFVISNVNYQDLTKHILNEKEKEQYEQTGNQRIY